jgi:hypothetical protein
MKTRDVRTSGKTRYECPSAVTSCPMNHGWLVLTPPVLNPSVDTDARRLNVGGDHARVRLLGNHANGDEMPIPPGHNVCLGVWLDAWVVQPLRWTGNSQ